MNNGNLEEQFVSWDNVPIYKSYLQAHYEEFSTKVSKVSDQREGEKLAAKSLLQFREKIDTFLRLCNIRIPTHEEARNESLVRIIN